MDYKIYVCPECKKEYAITDHLASVAGKLICEKCGSEIKEK